MDSRICIVRKHAFCFFFWLIPLFDMLLTLSVERLVSKFIPKCLCKYGKQSKLQNIDMVILLYIAMLSHDCEFPTD